MQHREDFLLKAYELGIIKFGNFTLKSGIESPFYVDLRPLASSPQLLKTLANNLLDLVEEAPFELICGVPYAALPMGTTMSLASGVPLIIKRKEDKGYGTKRMVEGVYQAGQNCLLVEDVITSGQSLLETIAEIEKEGLVVTDITVVLDREQGGIKRLRDKGYRVHTLFTINDVIDILHRYHRLNDKEVQRVKNFLDNPPAPPVMKRVALEEKDLRHPVAKRLIRIALDKKSNLIASADVITSAELLRLANSVGPNIVALKTHIDILTDFTPEVIDKLKELAKKHNFLLFEDRKFSDIGNTQELQFKDGVSKIAGWADMITAHMIAGEESLKVFDNVGVVGIVEMSTKGTLTDDYYVNKALNTAENSPNVLGAVAQRKISDKLLLFTPGVNLSATGDSKGQQYNTPDRVFKEKHTDFMIVGRGIYRAADPAEAAAEYQKKGWEAYLESLN